MSKVFWNTYWWVVCGTCSPVFSSDIRKQFKSLWEIIFAGRWLPSGFNGCTLCYGWCRVQNVCQTSPLSRYQPNWKHLSPGKDAIIIKYYWTKYHYRKLKTIFCESPQPYWIFLKKVRCNYWVYGKAYETYRKDQGKQNQVLNFYCLRPN